MTGGGKRGKPKSRFPTLPTALGNPQEQRIPTFHTATTAGDRLKAPPNPQHPKVGQIKPPKWAKRSCQTQTVILGSGRAAQNLPCGVDCQSRSGPAALESEHVGANRGVRALARA